MLGVFVFVASWRIVVFRRLVSRAGMSNSPQKQCVWGRGEVQRSSILWHRFPNQVASLSKCRGRLWPSPQFKGRAFCGIGFQIKSRLCRSAEADCGRHHVYGTHAVGVPGAGISRVRVQANCPKVACVIALLALL